MPRKLHGTSITMKVREARRKGRTPSLADSILKKLVFFLIDLWFSTCRPVVEGQWNFERFSGRREPVIIAIWHARVIYTLYHFRRHPAAVIVSASSDGDWVARYVRRHGQVPVLGSRHKGGAQAGKEIVAAMRDRKLNAGIVADGSRGPAEKAQIGAIVMARETGAPIVPTGMAARHAIRFKSWDRTVLPLPFSRIVMVYEEPVMVPEDAKGAGIEKFRRRLEEALNSANEKAERILQST